MSVLSSRNRKFLLIVVAAIALSVPWLGRPFHTRGEPREALVAQAMVATGNWISPPAYDGAVPSKPPFSHWLIALASLPSGKVTETTSRLPSALAFILFSASFFLFVARRTNPAVALTSGLILLSCSEWFRAASTCRVDTILSTSMAGALLAYFAWWERGYRGVPWVAFALTICSALTKGPIGIVLPVGIFSLFCWLKRDWSMKDLAPIAGRALAVAVPVVMVVSTWYVLGYLQRGDEFLDKIRYENFERFTSSMQDEPHKHSFLYLFGMLGLGVLPWTVFVLGAAIRNRLWKGTTRGALVNRWRSLPDLYQFSLLAAAAIVLFFCIPSSKRSVYLLPAYPFLALLIERVVRGGCERMGQILSWVVLGVSCIATVLGVGLLFVPAFGVSLRIESFIQSLSVLKLVSSVGVLALCAWIVRQDGSVVARSGIDRLALSMIGAVFVVSFFVYDTVAGQLSEKQWLRSPDFVSRVDLSSRERLYSFGSESYGASFYLEKPFSRVTGQIPPGSVIFVEQRSMGELRGVLGVDLREVWRHTSGLEKPSRDLLVVITGPFS
jgi:4-amino-4-deoxy-L-arabinose transferase-like glycosyltransferase